MKRFGAIFAVGTWLVIGTMLLGGGCQFLTLDRVEQIGVVSNLLDEAEARLDAEIASEETQIAALEAQLAAAEIAAATDNDPVEPNPTDPEAMNDIPTGTRWLHGGGAVANWPVTANLAAVTITGGGLVELAYDKAKRWPTANVEGGTVGNPWVFVQVNGTWYAATWEWLKPGQTVKDMRGKSWGGHIKAAPLSNWEPKSGERIGWMVSTLARSAIRTINERSNIVWEEWP